jgi:hypothetical protein
MKIPANDKEQHFRTHVACLKNNENTTKKIRVYEVLPKHRCAEGWEVWREKYWAGGRGA